MTAILQRVGIEAYADEELRPLLLDEPSVMGVESIEVDQLNIRVVARTLPGKQFDVGRRLRTRIAEALRKEGIIVAPDAGHRSAEQPGMTVRRFRPSTLALTAVFVALLTLYLLVRPPPADATPSKPDADLPRRPARPRPSKSETKTPKPSETSTTPTPSRHTEYDGVGNVDAIGDAQPHSVVRTRHRPLQPRAP